MQCQWLGERVAAPSLRTVVRNAITREPAPNWGPNATFKFPTHGGTGGIWTAVADMLSEKSLRMGKTAVVKSVDPAKKQVHFSSGKTVQYKNLVSTMALDGLLDRLDVPKEKLDPLLDAAKGLVFSSTIVLGLGIRGTRPERIGDKCKRFTPFSTIRH
jgi:protoporphyrinogen oxidase